MRLARGERRGRWCCSMDKQGGEVLLGRAGAVEKVAVQTTHGDAVGGCSSGAPAPDRAPVTTADTRGGCPASC